MRLLAFLFALLIAHAAHAQGCYIDQYGRQICPNQVQPQYQPQFVPRQQRQQTEQPPLAVVRIGNTVNGQPILGSGTIIESGIITCAHLFKDGVGELAIKIPGRDSVSAELIEVDHANDLALLAATVDVDPMPVASQAPKSGDIVASSGYGPPPRDYQTNTGRARQYVRLSDVIDGQTVKQNGFMALEISGSARQGDSGGPMFNDRGELVGVISGTDQRTVVGTCCVRIREFLGRIRSQRSQRQPQLKPVAPYRDADRQVDTNNDQRLLLDRIAGLERDLEAAKSAEHVCGDDCQCKNGELAKLQAELLAAQNKPPATLPPEIVEKEKIVEVPGPERIIEKIIKAPAAAAESFLTAKGVAVLVGFGVPGWIAAFGIWVAKRRIKKRLNARLASKEGDQSAMTAVANPSPAAQPEPNAVTNYHLSDAYAANLAQKRAHEGASIPQEALMGQLYKAALGKYRNGKTLAEAQLAKKIEEEVREEFLNRHGVRTTY